MKFRCERCKTRYSIAEEKIRGKILKIRCKNCATVISVWEGMGAQPKAEPKPAAPVLAEAFQRAMEMPMAEGPLDTLADDKTRVGGMPNFSGEGLAAPAPTHDSQPVFGEWYLSVDGSQDGPLSLEAAQARVARKRPDEELYAWRDGFDDWLLVKDVAELSSSLPALSSPGSMDGPPSGTDTVSDQRKDDSFDFNIGEASRVVRLNDVSLPRPALGQNGRASSARGSGREQALQNAEANPALLVLPPRRRNWGPVVAISGVVLACVVGVLVVTIVRGLRRNSASASVGSAARGSSAIEDGIFSTQFVENRVPDKSAPERRPVPRPQPPRAPMGAVPTTPTAPTGMTDRPPPTTPEVVVSLGGRTPAPSESLRPLSSDDVLAVYNKQQAGLRWCYEKALKQNPDLKVNRMDVRLTIAPTGRVSQVDVVNGGDPGVNGCVRQKIAAWSFRQATKDFTMQFPLAFQ